MDVGAIKNRKKLDKDFFVVKSFFYLTCGNECKKQKRFSHVNEKKIHHGIRKREN